MQDLFCKQIYECFFFLMILTTVVQIYRSAFAKPGLDSITPIPDSSVPIGQTDGMSKIDILRVNRLYQC